ncbi:hypothetical protein I5F71_02875 [Pseudomonas aeruginosa]|nr:hypothetical protein [Pseudomonas aeruginosa]MBG4718191.1 hypothetical protein [Pseudomonas aeruginosa]
MSKILDFPQKPEPHAVGTAICTKCRYEWSAAAPVGTTQLECPQCHTENGLFKHPFGPAEGDCSYVCNCGSDLYFILRRKGQAVARIICRGCGQDATGWFE